MNPKNFSKNHNGVYNNEDKTKRTKKTLGGFCSNRKKGEGTQKNPFRFATIETGQNEPKNHKGVYSNIEKRKGTKKILGGL
jgi:hypothetical protein